MPPRDLPTAVRLDKWLWAARFFKTRSAATEAVAGGKVALNGEPAKPARTVKAGDELRIRLAPYEWTLTITALGERRGTAEQAAALYQEHPESLAARERQREQLRLAPSFTFDEGKPSKKDRRLLGRLKGKR